MPAVLSRLENLPLDVFLEILNLLDPASVASLSLVNHGLRESCIGRVFKSITADFSIDSFNSLQEIIGSPLARNVRTMVY